MNLKKMKTSMNLSSRNKNCFAQSFKDHNTSEKKRDSKQQKDEVDRFIELDLNSKTFHDSLEF
jgi:hypothetical protein